MEEAVYPRPEEQQVQDTCGSAAPSTEGIDLAKRTRIAVVGINYLPELTGIAVYTTGMAEYLRAEGHDVTVYSAFSYYPAWSKQQSDRRRLRRNEVTNGVSIRRSYVWVPRKPTALRRILHEASFVLSSFFNYLSGSRADITIILSPPLLLGLPIALLAKLKRSTTILHVQDLQPDAAVDMGMLKPGLLTSMLFVIERMTYKLVDRVSTISHSMQRKIIGKGIDRDKVLLFTNWAHDHLVAPMSRQTRFSRDLALDDKFVVLYSGNMGVKQGLDTVIDAAHMLRDDPSIAFLLVGDGGNRAALQARAARLELANVSFLPLQPLDRLSELLATADVGVIPQIVSANDNVLPSKLPNVMASQRPVIVAASENSELGGIIRHAQCGVRIEPEHPRQLADAILQLKHRREDCARMGLNGRTYMEANFSRNSVLGRFAAVVRSL